MDGCKRDNKVQFLADVKSNIAIGPAFYRATLSLDAVGIVAFKDSMPGQFAEFKVSDIALPPADSIPEELADKSQRQIILRRPFSFADIRKTESSTEIDVLYCVLGPGTLRMTTLTGGDKIGVIGPLGNGFTVPKTKTTALLIAGGMGAPPLQHLAIYLKKNHPEIKTIAFAGAQTTNDLPFVLEQDKNNTTQLSEFSKCDVPSYIATDDGSAGYKGFVTDAADKYIDENGLDPNSTIIYTCGPEPMLAACAKLAKKYGIDCQVSTERMMACGIGLCQSCAVETKEAGASETEYKLCCKDGPIFDSRELVFSS
jgi:dihydroorotate dehydrogenase electron transfer subunit